MRLTDQCKTDIMKRKTHETERAAAVACTVWLGILVMWQFSCYGCGQSVGLLPYLFRGEGRVGNDVHKPDSVNQVGRYGIERWGNTHCGSLLLHNGEIVLVHGLAYLHAKQPMLLAIPRFNLSPVPSFLKVGIYADADSAAENTSTGAKQTDNETLSHIIVSGSMGGTLGIVGFVVGIWCYSRWFLPNDQVESRPGEQPKL